MKDFAKSDFIQRDRPSYTLIKEGSNVRLETEDADGLKALAEYIVRSPVSEGKIILSDDGHKVLYHDKLNPVSGRNFETYDALDYETGA